VTTGWLPGLGKTEISQSLPVPNRPDKGFSHHQFAPFASPAVDKTTKFWSESNAVSHYRTEAKLLMKPVVTHEKTSIRDYPHHQRPIISPILGLQLRRARPSEVRAGS